MWRAGTVCADEEQGVCTSAGVNNRVIYANVPAGGIERIAPQEHMCINMSACNLLKYYSSISKSPVAHAAGALIPTVFVSLRPCVKIPQCSTPEHLTKRCHARSAEDGRVVSAKKQ